VTARELDSQFEWAAHEAEALREGSRRDHRDDRHRRGIGGLDEPTRSSSSSAARSLRPASQLGDLRPRAGAVRPAQLIDLVGLMGITQPTAAMLTASTCSSIPISAAFAGSGAAVAS